MSELNKAGEQAQNGNSTAWDNQPSTQTYSVNGQEMTWDKLLESYNNLQTEFTKKSQKLSEFEKSNSNPELEQTKKVLLDMWFTTKEQIEELKQFKDQVLTEKQKQEQEQEFNEFVWKYNTLSDSQKDIIRDLKKVHSDKDYLEILKTTNFLDQALLEKSKTGWDIKGDSLWIPQPEKKEEINPKVARKFWLKSKSEIDEIKSKFNL